MCKVARARVSNHQSGNHAEAQVVLYYHHNLSFDWSSFVILGDRVGCCQAERRRQDLADVQVYACVGAGQLPGPAKAGTDIFIPWWQCNVCSGSAVGCTNPIND
jgi:hypothetical protein